MSIMNYDGIVYYTKGPEKYNKDWWYSFQIDCATTSGLKNLKYPSQARTFDYFLRTPQY